MLRKNGKLTPIRKIRKNGILYYRCVCDCGTKKTIRAKALYANGTKSCGCSRLGMKNRLTHGGSRTLTYSSWTHMLDRCYKENTINYNRYGGRGIYVCARWHDFSAFLEDMGERKPDLSIDRINNNGSYTCGHCVQCIDRKQTFNCRWASRKVQQNNRCNNVHDHANRQEQ